jgi:predicted aconitase
MTTAITEDNLKSFSAAAASSGAVGLFHVIGVTPEAPDIETCFRNGKPKDTVVITPEMIVSAESRLIQGTCSVPDLITLGCPHYSVEEFKTLEKYLDSRKIKSGIEFWVFTSRKTRCKNFYGWMRVTISEKELGFYMCHVGLR